MTGAVPTQDATKKVKQTQITKKRVKRDQICESDVNIVCNRLPLTGIRQSGKLRRRMHLRGNALLDRYPHL